MKNKFTHNLLGKVASGLLAILLIVCAVWAIDVNGNQVEAATETETVDYVVESYSYDKITQFRVKDKNGNYGIPTCTSEGEWLFAGWFKNDACTSALGSGESPVSGTTYYAKFVSADVLSVKCQMTSGTNANSPETVLRCVSSVDSLRYKNIGFELELPDGTTKYMESAKVGTRINAKEGTDAYSYSPKVVDTESEYFYSAIETIKNENDNFSKGYIIKPYWITKDGTKVYGVSRYVTVNEYIEKNIMYIPVKMDATPTSTAVTANGSDLTYVTYDADSGYAHFSLAVNTSSLKSVTTYDIAGTCDDKTVDTSFSYRNLGTKYQGADANIDDSWYNSDEDEFVIATSADLYGLAKVVNAGTDSFANKSVYVVCDIEVNKGYADHDNLAWDTSKDADGNILPTGTTGTEYPWTRIGVGDDTGRFAGTFDGQMHTISGLYLENGPAKSGLFAEVEGTTILKNFKLTNSYFGVNDQDNTGSIVGYAWGGTFDSIYSEAIVNGGDEAAGGLLGTVQSEDDFTMKNCWFNGTVESDYRWMGGMIGRISKTSYSHTITNCLNTGKVTGVGTSSKYVGGLIGYNYLGSALEISYCMNSGTIGYDSSYANPTTYCLIGNGSASPTISYTYSINQDNLSYYYNGVVNTDYTVDESAIEGTLALTADTKSLFAYVTDTDTYANESYWAIVQGGAPVLSAFAKDAKVNQYQAVDTSWYNKNNSSFTLKDAADFYGFALLSRDSSVEGFSSKTVKLGSDIVMNKGIVYSAEYETGVAEGVTPIEWLPIGTSSSSTYFKGTFNGQGNNISGIYLNATDNQNGLFRMTYDAIVKDFSLTNSFINGSSQTGSVVGRACSGTFDTIYSSAIVKASSSQTGGIVGHMQGGETDFIMNNCWFDGTVSSSNNSIGGLVGRIYTKSGYTRTITNCLNTGDVIANTSTIKHVGGLVGYSDCANNTLVISDCLNTGEIGYEEVTDEVFATYGLIGGTLQETTTYESVYTTSQSEVSYVKGSSNADYTLEAALIYGTGAMEKMPTFYDLITVDDKYKVYWAATETTPILGDFIEFAEEGVVAVAFDTSWYDGSKNYTLYDESDLYGFAKLSEVEDFAEETVKLGADITIPNSGTAGEWMASTDNAPSFNWPGIGIENCTFNGNFNGDKHTISEIYKNSNTKYSGLFNHTGKNAVIQDFSLTNSYFTSTAACLGSVAGLGRGIYENIYSDAIVVGEKESIGGLIGYAYTSSATNIGTVVDMSNCWFDGSVTNNGNSTSDRYTGGLIGRIGCHTEISNCLNTGKVSVPNYTAANSDKTIRPYAGGLVGLLASSSTLTINYCLNTGKVIYNETATHAYGAIVGGANSGAIKGGTGVYATTSSCSSYAYVTSGATSELTVLDNHVVDSTMLGEAARNTKLFVAETNGAWATVNNATPILTYFAEKATTGEAVALTNVQLAVSNTTTGTYIDKGTVESSITFTDDSTKDSVIRRQGGCYTVEDGKVYYYQTFIRSYYVYEQKDNNGDDVVNNMDNLVVVVKYDWETQTEVMRSEDLMLCHTNDMTYNDKLDLLIVAHANNDMHRVSIIDPDTLELVGTKYIDGLSFYSIDYNSNYDCYVVQTGANTDTDGHDLVILNSKWEIIAKHEGDGELYTDPKLITASGAQGMGCDDKYIYCLFSSSASPRTHAITVFDWNGDYVTEIMFTIDDEPETVSLVGNQILVNVAGASKVYSITF